MFMLKLFCSVLFRTFKMVANGGVHLLWNLHVFLVKKKCARGVNVLQFRLPEKIGKTHKRPKPNVVLQKSTRSNLMC